MEETVQQALFGGNITGRRLRGVKINPIYQGNDPSGRGGRAIDTHSESALPIGEIQIEVYESLPRNFRKPFRQCKSSPAIPSPPNHSLEGSEPEDVQARSEVAVSSVGEDRARGEEHLHGRNDAQTTSSVVSRGLEMGHISETSLQERRPVGLTPDQREHGNEGDRSPKQGHQKSKEQFEAGGHQTRATLAAKPLCGLLLAPSLEQIDVITDEGADEDIDVWEMFGEDGLQESCGTAWNGDEFCPSHSELNPQEYQAYFVSVDYGKTFARYLPHISPVNESTHSQDPHPSSDKIVCSDDDQLHQGDSHSSETCYIKHKPEINSENSEKAHNEQMETNHHSSTAKDLKDNQNVAHVGGHMPCLCLCHSEHSVNDVYKLPGSLTQLKQHVHLLENGENSRSDSTRQDTSTESVSCTTDNHTPPGENGDDNVLHEETSCLSSSETKEHYTNISHYHDLGVDYDQDPENNNDWPEIQLCRKQTSSPTVPEQVSIEASDLLSSHQEENRPVVCPSNFENAICVDTGKSNLPLVTRNQVNENSQSNNLCYEAIKLHISGIHETGHEESVCKLCGCILISYPEPRQDSTCPKSGTSQDGNYEHDDITSTDLSKQHAASHNVLSSDSVLLKVNELNAPTYLHRYLAEAQRNYIRTHDEKLLHDDSINKDTNIFALPSSDDVPAIPADVMEQLQQDDVKPSESKTKENSLSDPRIGHLQEGVDINGDSVSFVEELGCHGTKTSCWKNPFKSSAGGGTASKASSRQNSQTNSRQSSRNSRSAKHSSIEDIDAEYDEEGLAGSQWGGSSSNRSNSIIDRNENLKKAGLSVIHVGGTSTDPAFEMIVPCDEAYEVESNYSSRRRQRLEEIAEQNGWNEEKAPLKERIIKAAVFTLIFGVIVGIFIGVAIHFGKTSGEDDGSMAGSSGSRADLGGGSLHGFKRPYTPHHIYRFAPQNNEAPCRRLTAHAQSRSPEWSDEGMED